MKILAVSLLMFAALPAIGQTVLCSAKFPDCPHMQEIDAIVKQLPAPSDWTVVAITQHAKWSSICVNRCDTFAFSLLNSHRTYLDVEHIYRRFGDAGVKTLLAHELGHILTNSESESVADRKAYEIRRSLHW